MKQSQSMVLKSKSATASSACVESKGVDDTKALLAELCRHFYTLGWVLGTGGSVIIKVHDESVPGSHQLIVMSPSGDQKERIVPEDMYVMSSDGFILSVPPLKSYPYPPLIVHLSSWSHGMEACLATMINPSSNEFRITHMEMIKGIQGHGYHDELVVPIIENTAFEGELRESVTDTIRAYPKTRAVLVRSHGVFIWGDSWTSAKTQAESYHHLFGAAIKLHQLGLNWSSPNHGLNCSFKRGWGCGNIGRALDYLTEPSKRCILLNVEGTTAPVSYVTDILFAYVCDSIGEHLASTYDTEETQCDSILLCSQIQDDLEQGVASALPISPDYVGTDLVIASLVANVEAMIRVDREVTALKPLQGHEWRAGFQSKELVGVIFGDVTDALESGMLQG